MRFHRKRALRTILAASYLGLLYLLFEKYQDKASDVDVVKGERQITDEYRLFPVETYHTAANATYRVDGYVPGPWIFLPHLGKNTRYLHPRFTQSAGRKNVMFVFGIPTVRRSLKLYLLDTLKSLFDNMSEEEAKQVVIVVSITEPWNITYEKDLIKKLQNRFDRQLGQGSLEIISPYPEYYPDLDHLPQSFGDSQDRVKWRSKQNLDYAFLMMYASTRGQFYLQLEDDISTVKGFLTSMKTSIAEQKGQWTLLSFSRLGFIARLFKQRDLPGLLTFMMMFYAKKPCDWLLPDFLALQVCAGVPCQDQVRFIKPSLFQHVGLHSSLKGVIKTFNDRFFAGNPSQKALPQNPPVKEIICTFKTFINNTIDKSYNGKGFFWGLAPRAEDFIEFIYHPPISIKRIAFQSRHEFSPFDVIDRADIDVMPETVPSGNMSYARAIKASSRPAGSSSSVPYYTVGKFDMDGIVDIELDEAFGKIRSFRIRFTMDYVHWVTIEQIVILLREGGT